MTWSPPQVCDFPYFFLTGSLNICERFFLYVTGFLLFFTWNLSILPSATAASLWVPRYQGTMGTSAAMVEGFDAAAVLNRWCSQRSRAVVLEHSASSASWLYLQIAKMFPCTGSIVAAGNISMAAVMWWGQTGMSPLTASAEKLVDYAVM